ncbi:MAG: DUF1684 domain-containing protein [Pseudomonadota bacterium]
MSSSSTARAASGRNDRSATKGPIASAPQAMLDLADWRRRVATLYAEVRGVADPGRAWAHWRAARDALLQRHPASPLPAEKRAAARDLPYGAYDPAWRFLVELSPLSANVRRAEGGADGEIRLRPFAKTRGLAEGLGVELTLFWVEGYGGGLFLPFKDRSSGRTSYGGGRYLLDGIKGADLGTAPDGRLILDFNFAYNPSCAHDPRWVCPLAPPENRVDAEVPVGELFEPARPAWAGAPSGRSGEPG